ncbi:MAG: hypothetical protein DRP35_02035 [Candidatus Zixiibacteriota bacterium]|nr:MAG: hypothetical protein DRP35_02035 [candidate division Zixibacteria bacterium]
MNVNIEYREVKTSDIEEVISFHNRLYNDKRTSEQWLWEYKSEYPDNYVFTVALDENRIISTQGMLPIITVLKGKNLLCSKSENSLLDTDYRGKTIFHDLYEYAMDKCEKKGMRFVFGLTTAVKVMEKKLGFHVYVDAMYKLTTSLNFGAAQRDIFYSKRNIFKKIVKSMLVSYQHITSSFKRRNIKSKSDNYSVKQKLIDIKDMDIFYKHLRDQYPNLIHLYQDEIFMRWRIHNNPFIEYKTYFLYQGERLKAYCYFNSQDRITAYLSDFTFEDTEAGIFLLEKIMTDLCKEKIAYISFVGNVKNDLINKTFKLLKKSGFTSSGFMPFIIRNISFEDEDYLYDINNWYINGLWTEGTTI